MALDRKRWMVHASPNRHQGRPLVDVIVTVAASVATGFLLTTLTGSSSLGNLIAVVVGLVVPAVAALSILRRRPPSVTKADSVTLARAVLVGGCATVIVLSLFGNLPLRSWLLFALALPALLLDGVDGWVARRTGTASAEGGRLDMETDAVFLLILSIALAPTVGFWVLGIGAMRYFFWAAAWWRPALVGKLAFSQFRRVIAGIQGGVLVGALLPVIPPIVATVSAALALGLLTVSFGKDTLTLERRNARARMANDRSPGLRQ